MSHVDSAGEIICDLQEHVLRLTIARPEKMNALSPGMYGSLADALERADGDPEVRAVLIRGEGTCFTSGNDLRDFLKSPPAGEDSPVFRFLRAISEAKSPIVAAVLGPAVGVGTTMLLHCDLVYAGESARFELPFVSLGLCPEAACSLLLPQLAGHQRAAELLLLGEPFDAGQARDLGLVNRILSDGDLHEYALDVARKLAVRPPEAVRLTKRLLREGGRRAVAETMAEEGRHFLQRLASPEAKEAFTAFFKRRKPDFDKMERDPSSGA